MKNPIRLTLLLLFMPWFALGAVETQLQVTANDDGLPNGALNYTWTVASAPAGAVTPQILAAPSVTVPAASAQNPRVVLNSAGTYVFHVAVSDGVLTTQGTSAQDVTITVLPAVPVITTASLPAGQVGTTYSQTLAASNSPTSWTVSSGALPLGLNLAATTGTITGAPTSQSSSTFTVTARNSGGTSAPQTLTILVNPATPVITTTSLPGGTQSVAYQQTLQANPTPTGWQIVSGVLPAGLSLNLVTGEITGTPNTLVTATFAVKASNAGGTSSAVTLTIAIVPLVNARPTISTIANQLIAKGTATTALPFTIGDTETPAGNLTLSASASSTALVPNANIVFGGSGANRTVIVTPASGQSGTVTITITVTDGSGASASSSFVLTINAPPVITAVSAAQTTLNLP